MRNTKIFCQLPKAGLGNQLFPLVKALVNAQITHRRIKVCNNVRFSPGPFLRGEKNKRIYRNIFSFPGGLMNELDCQLELLYCKLKGKIRYNPFIDDEDSDFVFVFDAIPHWSNYFDGLNIYRKQSIESFFSILQESVVKEYEFLVPPSIGVHIRMGDFRELKEGEDFKKVGSVRTPLSYFKEVIQNIRNTHGAEMPVTVFSDGREEQLAELFALPEIYLAKPQRDILDLLQLSKSSIIITSAGSTFSYWSGFLSDAPVILHPDHIHQRIRLEKNLYEGDISGYIKWYKEKSMEHGQIKGN